MPLYSLPRTSASSIADRAHQHLTALLVTAAELRAERDASRPRSSASLWSPSTPMDESRRSLSDALDLGCLSPSASARQARRHGPVVHRAPGQDAKPQRRWGSASGDAQRRVATRVATPETEWRFDVQCSSVMTSGSDKRQELTRWHLPQRAPWRLKPILSAPEAPMCWLNAPAQGTLDVPV